MKKPWLQTGGSIWFRGLGSEDVKEGDVCNIYFSNSNTLNSNDQNKKPMTALICCDAYGYTHKKSLVLNIGNSDFGFVSYFMHRISLGILYPER